jgi:hypothetical protein
LIKKPKIVQIPQHVKATPLSFDEERFIQPFAFAVPRI